MFISIKTDSSVKTITVRLANGNNTLKRNNF